MRWRPADAVEGGAVGGDGSGGGGGGVGAPGSTTSVSGTLEDQFPRFVVQSEGQMWACNQTVSDCLADHTCLPVGGQSVWAAATRLRPTADVDYVAVSAPMDSAAFFHSRAIGAVAEVSALVTMLAVAEAFGSVVAANRTRPLRRVPVFMGFNAEAYGYAGSRRFLNDIVNFECADEEDAGSMGSGVCETPHYMSSLKFQAFRRQPSDGTEDGGTTTRFTHVLDVGPVGSAAKLREPVTLEPVNATAAADATPRPVTLADLETPPFFAHASETSTGLRDLLLAAFSRVEPPPAAGGVSNVSLAAASSTNWTLFPPTSGQSFISEAPSPSGAPQVVSLVDYDNAFRDQFYHSELSTLPADPAPLATAIELAARGLVRTLVALAYFGVDTTPGNAGATELEALMDDPEYSPLAQAAADGVQATSITGLLTCLTGNWTDCELASDLLGDSIRDQLARSVSPSNYASTYVPPTRAASITPSAAAKVRLLRAFLANATAYLGTTGEPVRCNDACASALEADPEALHCIRDRCVAADAYTHNAYGHGLQPANVAQSAFVLRDGNSSVRGGAWTESYWDRSLGVCGATEDAFVLSIGILFAGLGVLAGAIGLSAAVAWALSEGKGTSVVRGAEGGAV